ncbi:MAG: hypothetical protein IKP06_05030 [Elusimicrobiaceae bacterium]|nr:hypothetical protein [Elusimicrobiaceae bacterium]
MANERLRALFKLLGSEPGSHSSVLRREIADAIKTDPVGVQTALEKEFPQHTPLCVINILEEIAWDDLTRALVQFAAKINPDLEEGLTLLAKFNVPATTRKHIAIPTDEIAMALRPALLNAKDYAEIAQAFAHYFFKTLEIQTLPANWDIQEISFVRFLHKHRGSSLCIACLYILVGERYGLDINLIDVAGRILVHLQDTEKTQSLFIDPLDNGKILSLQDCQAYIDSRQLSWSNDFLTPLSSRQIVRRFIANMIFVLNKVRDERRLSYLRNYLEIMRS